MPPAVGEVGSIADAPGSTWLLKTLSLKGRMMQDSQILSSKLYNNGNCVLCIFHRHSKGSKEVMTSTDLISGSRSQASYSSLTATVL